MDGREQEEMGSKTNGAVQMDPSANQEEPEMKEVFFGLTKRYNNGTGDAVGHTD